MRGQGTVFAEQSASSMFASSSKDCPIESLSKAKKDDEWPSLLRCNRLLSEEATRHSAFLCVLA